MHSVKRQGALMPSELALVTMAVLIALVVATAVTFNLQFAQRFDNDQIATHLAQSAVQQAMAQLMGNPAWQADVSIPGPPHCSGSLTFNSSSGGPYSTNNQNGAQPTGWNGSRLLSSATVPTNYVHLVATGNCYNSQHTVEALVCVPNYTFAIASTGEVQLDNSLVGSLKSLSDFANLGSNPSLLGPGDLLTSVGSSPAVVLKNTSQVEGNVQSTGTVDVEPGSIVDGELRSPWSNTPIPSFNANDYDPAIGDVLNYQSLSSPLNGNQNLVGLSRGTGSLVVNGDLVLDNAVLYVPGNLIVNGGIRGVGSGMVAGTTTVTGGSSLSTDDCVALVSNGDVNFISADSNTYQFNGLVYTGGNFVGKQFVVLGAFVANGPAGGGNINLEGCQVYQTSSSANVSMFYPQEMVLQIASCNPPSFYNITQANSNIVTVGNFPGNGGTTYPVPWVTPEQASAHVNGLPYMGYEAADSGPWHWYDTVTVQVQKQNNLVTYLLNYKPSLGVPLPETFTSSVALGNRLAQISLTMCPDYNNPALNTAHETYAEHQAFFQNFLPPLPSGSGPNYYIAPNSFLQTQMKVRISSIIDY